MDKSPQFNYENSLPTKSIYYLVSFIMYVITIISFEYRLLLHRHSAHCQYKTTLDKATIKNPKYIECEISILSPLPNKIEICTRIS